MPFTEWKEFWWNNVTGPRALMTKVVDSLLDKNMVVLIVPDDLPWRHDMRNAIEIAFKQRAPVSNMTILQIDAVDEWPSDVEPGRYLLKRFASAEVYKAYREKAGVTLQKYMRQNAVLKNTIVWVKGLDATQAECWVKFCKEYVPPSMEDGLIVLEIRGDSSFTDMRKVRIGRLTDFVSSYDLQLFNSFVLDDHPSYSETWKRYVSTLAAQLCDTDAEVSEKLISITDFQTDEPLNGVGQVANLIEFERRGRRDSRHILACYRDRAIGEIQNRIWSAQVQTLFPLIEFERMDIVSSLSGEIQKMLDTHVIYQYNKRLTDPLDMELGTLVYHFSHRSDDYNYYIYIPDEAVRNRIRFLHECRNVLAHSDCLSVKQVYTLIEGIYVNSEPQ